MTTLPSLTAKIQSLCPELLKLSVGCEFIYKGKNYIFTSSTGMMTDIHQGCHSIFIAKRKGLADMEDYIRISKEYEIAILGHPITLEHCRMALRRWAAENTNHLHPQAILGIEQDRLAIDVTRLWQDLKPFESQHEVHEFLSQYLLNDSE